MAVRSRRLWGPTLVVVLAPVTVLVVPAGRTAIVRSTLIYNNSPVVGSLILTLNLATLFEQRVDIGQSATLPYFVMNPGDELRAGTNSAAQLVCSGFGSLLFGAPT